MKLPGPDPTVPDHVEVRIEVPRGGHLKRRHDGTLDFISPVPCPYNYGSIPSIPGWDGAPLDAVVLGRSMAAGSQCLARVQGMIRFVDGGVWDPKLICADGPLSEWERRGVVGFFRLYAVAKRVLHRLRRDAVGETRYLGYLERDGGPAVAGDR
jgi:inorganic pyrophosphatase